MEHLKSTSLAVLNGIEAPGANGKGSGHLPQEATGTTTVKCPTELIEDFPSTEDFFSTEESFGPHRRISEAIANLIQTQPVGISIGLEGNWGSGKTTVINLLGAELEKRNRGDEYALVAFDAWVHEGDPLRRTFLENLIRQLQAKRWIDSGKWNERLEEIAQRREVRSKKTTPKLTGIGKGVGLSFFLIPLGSALLTQVLTHNLKPTLQLSLIEPISTGVVIIGIIFTLAPLLVLLAGMISQRLQVLSRQVKRISRRAKPTQPLDNGQTKAPPSKSRGEPKMQLWGMLFNRVITEESTETTKTPNPTSIEFEASFKEVMKEALVDPQRRLVLVLDNLDRVAPDDALLIWSTLQVFLRHSHYERPEWYKRISVLVLYDPKGICLLWDRSKKSENNGAHEQPHNVALPFLDKSFQVRFEVPAPVRSDWRNFLIRTLKKAFPDPKHEPDFHKVYQVMSLHAAQQDEIPTIRELKLYVNQIGAFHRQWKDELPLSHIAYYVLLRRKGEDILKELRSENPRIPSPEFDELLGTDLRESLAALSFNVQKEKSYQLILSGPINKALAEGDNVKLKNLAKAYDGFWEVLETVIKHDWLVGENQRTAVVANCLQQSGLFEKEERQEAKRVIEVLQKSAKQGVWDLFEEAKVKGFIALCTLTQNRNLAVFILKSIVDGLIADAGNGKSVDVGKWAKNQGDIIYAFYDLSWQHLLDDAVIDPIVERFKKDDELKDHELSILLEILHELRHQKIGLGMEANRALNKLTIQRDILEQLESREGRGPRAIAWCLLSLLWKLSEEVIYSISNSMKSADYLRLSALSTQAEVVKEFTELLIRYENLNLLFDICDRVTDSKPFIVSSLKLVLDGIHAQRLFTPQNLIKRWPLICEGLLPDERCAAALDTVIKQWVDTSYMTRNIWGENFEPERADLYVRVANNGGLQNSDFRDWCLTPLQSLSAEEWLAQLQQDGNLLHLALALAQGQPEFSIGPAYEEALTKYCKMAGEGDAGFFERFVEELQLIADPSKRDELRERFTADARTIAHFLTPPLFKRDVTALKWISQLLAESNLLVNSPDSHAVAEFKDQLLAAVNAGIDDEAAPYISDLARSLQLQQEPPTSSRGS